MVGKAENPGMGVMGNMRVYFEILRVFVCMQVLGSLNKAMESTALLNRIVWEEVIKKCREESFRMTESFRIRRETAQKIPDIDKHHLPVLHSSEKPDMHQPEPPSALAAPSQHPEAAGSRNGNVQSSCEAAAARSHSAPSGHSAIFNEGIVDAANAQAGAVSYITCNGLDAATQPQKANGIVSRQVPTSAFLEEGGPSLREPTDSSTCSTSSREKAHAAGIVYDLLPNSAATWLF